MSVSSEAQMKLEELIETALNRSQLPKEMCEEILSYGNAGILFSSGSIDSLKNSYNIFKNIKNDDLYLKKTLSKKNIKYYTKFRHFKKLNNFFNED